jgi:hypothetical protein
MRLIISIVVCGFLAAPTLAQDSVPDLKGTWIGQFKTVIFGHNAHHPGDQSVTDTPRIREITFTLNVSGQDGRVIWGEGWSKPDSREPFAIAIAVDGKTGYGADKDGVWAVTRISADNLEICYTHSGISPTQSIVASCGKVSRTAR